MCERFPDGGRLEVVATKAREHFRTSGLRKGTIYILKSALSAGFRHFFYPKDQGKRVLLTSIAECMRNTFK